MTPHKQEQSKSHNSTDKQNLLCTCFFPKGKCKSYAGGCSSYYQLVFIIFIFLFISCKKENTTINGNVWDLALDKPVMGGNVNLLERKSTISFESADYKILSTSTTDNNGNFEFHFHSKSKFRTSFSYFLEFVQPDGCYSSYGIKGFTMREKIEIESREENSVKIYIAPTAEIRITGNNLTPYDSNDEITVFAENNYSEQTLLYYKGTGQGADIGYQTILAGMTWLKWNVTKNNITNTIYGDTIYLNRCEKKEFTINY